MTGWGAHTTLLVDEDAGVLSVTLHRPEQRNAISEQMIHELSAVIAGAADRGDTLRAVVVGGSGGVFCAGGDLGEFKQSYQDGDRSRDAIATANRRYGTMLESLQRLPQVVIAAIDGPTMGGGVGFAAVADVTIATAASKFSLTETSLGLLPAQVAAFVVARVGAHRARRMMVTATRLSADEAARLALVDEVVSDRPALDEAVGRVLDSVRRCAPGANARTKELVARAGIDPIGTVLDWAAGAFADVMLGAEAKEGVAAFAERRSPAWTGE